MCDAEGRRESANAINNLREVHVASFNDGDVDPWIAAFTNDGVQVQQNNRETVNAPL